MIVAMAYSSYRSFCASSYDSEMEQLDTMSQAVGKAVSEKMDHILNVSVYFFKCWALEGLEKQTLRIEI